MSKEINLKKKLSTLLGTTILATALTAAPVSYNFVDLTIDDGAAYAKGGNSGSGSGHSGSGSDDDGDDNSGSGSSNSGGGSDDDDNGNSGNGSSNSGSGSDDDNDDIGRRSDRHDGRDDRGASSASIPAKFGYVVKAEVQGNDIEIGYSDGWKEEVENGRYELKNPANRTVVQRPATQDDINRLNASARASRL